MNKKNDHIKFKSGIAGNPLDENDYTSSKSLFINNCGLIRLDGSNRMNSFRNGRNDYMLFYLWSGKGAFYINGRAIEMTDGELFIWRPGEKLWFYLEQGYESQHYWLHFSGSECNEIINTCGFDSKPYCNIGQNQSFVNLLGKIIHEIQRNGKCSNLLCNAYFLEALCLVSDILHPDMEASTNVVSSKISPALEEMSMHFFENHPTSYYAQLCNLSLSRFIHLFTELTGITPNNYITSKRIEHAKMLLNTSSMPIADISFSVGYSDPLYFSRIFKKNTGCSPSKFRHPSNNGYTA